ncbi:glycosyltransferase [Candidatus Photodesmus blepharus]|uniref:Glycosyltransferase n=1 Tax=Candidatus Photodesmus blepharonis TaxID=1179155 RepID=A0A084CPL9_9GAMM|nr:glycosyltransferase [Candidatus Photodesmus blepharus]KEY91748.1 glycosyltransferase [Candidatus Photodesmus blepharus]
MKKNKRILFVHYGENWIRGSERCLLDLMLNIDRRHYTLFLWTNNTSIYRTANKIGVYSKLSSFSVLLGWKTPRFDLISWKKQIDFAKKYILEAKIDLVHVNSAAPCQWMYPATKLTKIRMITHLHSDYSAYERLTLGLHFSPRIIAVSKAITHQLISDGYPDHRLSIIPNGIDIERLSQHKTIDIKSKLDLPENSFIFTTIGSLIHRKGIDRIINALYHLIFKYPYIHLIVIGDGPLRHCLKQQTNQLNLKQHVHFVGVQKNTQGWLKNTNAFVSGSHKEAFGLVIAEAALAALPIVAPNEGGIPEIITHKKNGLLYKNSGTLPLIKAMLDILENPELSKIMGIKARKQILTHHTIARNIQRIETIYHNILSEKQQEKTSFFQAISPIKTFIFNKLR